MYSLIETFVHFCKSLWIRPSAKCHERECKKCVTFLALTWIGLCAELHHSMALLRPLVSLLKALIATFACAPATTVNALFSDQSIIAFLNAYKTFAIKRIHYGIPQSLAWVTISHCAFDQLNWIKDSCIMLWSSECSNGRLSVFSTRAGISLTFWEWEAVNESTSGPVSMCRQLYKPPLSSASEYCL